MITPLRTTLPMSLAQRWVRGTPEWFAYNPKGSQKYPPIFHNSNAEVLMAGREAFARIAQDINKAKESIDIICWGFDPAMELVRTGSKWPRGETFGELLARAGERGVVVRLLPWYSVAGDTVMSNVVGNDLGKNSFASVPLPLSGTTGELTNVSDVVQNASVAEVLTRMRMEVARAIPKNWDEWQKAFEAWWNETNALQSLQTSWKELQRLVQESTEIPEMQMRWWHNAYWWQMLMQGKMPNVQLRTRNGDGAAVRQQMNALNLGIDPVEAKLLSAAPTHHQKTILIDYEHQGGQNAVGYVMGLNSVTDYWDSEKHLYEDPLRGVSWEGHPDTGTPGANSLKPLADYACRLRGAALHALSVNFTQAWNKGTGGGLSHGSNLKRSTSVTDAPPKALVQGLGQDDRHHVQVLRTEPGYKESHIYDLYQITCQWATRYIYIENQYLQLSAWMQGLLQTRREFVRWYQRASGPKPPMPNLHLIMVLPTPEKPGMVPRTADTLKMVGLGENLPRHDEAMNQAIEDHKRAQLDYHGQMQHWDYLGKPPKKKPIPPGPLSPQAQDYLKAGEGRKDDEIRRQLEKEIAFKALAASLFTCDDPKKSREIYIHSKLMIIDDSMFTLGSANLNARSMGGDTEINMVCDNPRVSRELRERVWKKHTNGKLPGGNTQGDDMSNTFKNWKDMADNNWKDKNMGKPRTAHLTKFHDDRTALVRVA